MTPYLGQIVACAENVDDPKGWALCDGQLLPINQNQALFSLLGTTYGGNGVTTFALPNLEGRTVLGTGGSNGLGAAGLVSGASTINLTRANLPALLAPTIALADDTGAPGAPGHTTDGRVNVSGIAPGAAWSYSTDGGATFTTGVGTSFTLTGDGVKTVLVNQSWDPGEVSPSASLTFTLDPDILWQNANGQASIWEMSGTNVIGGGAVSPNPGPNWTDIGTGDFNGDGQSDILWQNANGQASIWEMNGTHAIGGGAVSPNPGTAWKAIGTGDFTDDGFADDILWRNTSTGQVSIWEMNGNTLMGGGPVSPNPGTAWKAIGTGDFNDDGHSDVLFQNTSSGQVSIWEMHGNTLTGGGPVSPNPGPSWHAIGTGDFTHDGFSDDILFQNTSTGQVSIWEMNGTSLMGGGPVSANPGTSWHAIGTGDGGSDILFQNTSGQTSIWDMNGNTLIGGGPVNPNPGPSWRAVGLT
jgi:microcystin-dependent protein